MRFSMNPISLLKTASLASKLALTFGAITIPVVMVAGTQLVVQNTQAQQLLTPEALQGLETLAQQPPIVPEEEVVKTEAPKEEVKGTTTKKKKKKKTEPAPVVVTPPPPKPLGFSSKHYNFKFNYKPQMGKVKSSYTYLGEFMWNTEKLRFTNSGTKIEIDASAWGGGNLKILKKYTLKAASGQIFQVNVYKNLGTGNWGFKASYKKQQASGATKVVIIYNFNVKNPDKLLKARKELKIIINSLRFSFKP